jgi:RNA polymerase sigma factor (sigma-70 family)
LLRAAFSGDRVAFQEMTEQLWGLVYVFIRQRVSDRQRSEDLTQETFLQAWEKRKTLRKPESAVSWLLAIASRKVIDAHRWYGSRPESPLTDPGETEATGTPPADREDEERSEQLRSALASVPEMYRTVLVLRYWSGLTPAQIARLLGEPEGTIRNRIFRAHLQLRSLLAETPHPRAEDGAERIDGEADRT